jgi:DNA-binding transcriptional LysR family regulator
MMDLHYLELFNTLAEYESYKKASSVLHISQPALSAQMKKLEGQIGLKLFDKIGNKVCLSENGIMLKEYTNRIFSIVEELENSISDTNHLIRGTVNIGGSNTPGTYILPEMIGAFKKIYPNTQFNLHIGNTAEISHLIDNGTLDIAVNGGTGTYGNNIYVEPLFSDKLLLVASPDNRYSRKKNITINELKMMSFIVHKTDSQLYTYYNKFIDELDIPQNINMYLGNIDAIKRAVISNLGISLIPYVAVRYELKFHLLKKLNFTSSQLSYPYSLIYNKNKALSATSKKFIEYMRTYMSEESHKISQ